jgi:hypothetical protein
VTKGREGSPQTNARTGGESFRGRTEGQPRVPTETRDWRPARVDATGTLEHVEPPVTGDLVEFLGQAHAISSLHSGGRFVDANRVSVAARNGDPSTCSPRRALRTAPLIGCCPPHAPPPSTPAAQRDPPPGGEGVEEGAMCDNDVRRRRQQQLHPALCSGMVSGLIKSPPSTAGLPLPPAACGPVAGPSSEAGALRSSNSSSATRRGVRVFHVRPQLQLAQARLGHRSSKRRFPSLRFRDLRHSAVPLLVAMGANLLQVSAGSATARCRSRPTSTDTASLRPTTSSSGDSTGRCAMHSPAPTSSRPPATPARAPDRSPHDGRHAVHQEWPQAGAPAE